MRKFLTSNWMQLCLAVAVGLYAKMTGQFELLPFIAFGTVARASGHPDYTQDGDAKNIPWAFSRKAVIKFYDKAICSNVCNTDYDGEIKNMGDKVIINTIPDISISAYAKGQDISWQDAEGSSVTMTMDRAQHFAFKMDKIDVKQFQDKSWMDRLSTDAAEQMKITIDTEFLLNIGGTTGANNLADANNKGIAAGRKSGSVNLGTTSTFITLTKTNILDKIIDCSTVMDEQNMPESDRWMVLPPWVIALIKKSDIKDASLTGDGSSSLRTGMIGSIDRWNIYVSNLLTKVDTSTGTPILFGHKSAICFATQLTETEYFDKLETTFGKGMKGLQVYDWKVIKSESLGAMIVD